VAGIVAAGLADAGPGPFTARSLLTAWTFDPLAIAGVVLLGAAYLAGVVRVRHAGGRWPAGRTLTFAIAGLGGLLAVTVGCIGRYAHTLFWARTLQVSVLLFVAPAFLALGRPLTLAAQALPPRVAGRLAAALRSGPARAGLNPMVGPLLLPVLCGLIFFTGIWEASLRHQFGYELLNAGLVVVGILVALPLAGEGADLPSTSIALVLLVGFVELLVDAIPGIVLRLRTSLIAPTYYPRPHGRWGPGPLADQRIGGAILWGIGEAIDLPFLALLVIRWIRADEREAARIDRELDAASRPGTAAGASHVPVRVPAGDPLPAQTDAITAGDLDRMLEPDRDVPWWEIDASVFGERRAAALERPSVRRRANRRAGGGPGPRHDGGT
jgi:putative membrane protein